MWMTSRSGPKSEPCSLPPQPAMQVLRLTHPIDGRRFTPETLVDVLRFRSTHQDTRTAFSFLSDGEIEGTFFTYAELDERARAVAVYLQKITKPNETVLLLFPQGLEFLAAFFGCLYAGRIAVPSGIPKSHRLDARIESIARDAGATVGLTTATFVKNVERPHIGLGLHPLDSIDSKLSTDWVPPAINSNSLAFLQYTSGSTSVPKGVMVTHGNVLYNSCYIHHDFDYQPSSVALTWLPHFHDMGLIEGLLQPILHGFHGYLMPAVFFLQQPVKWLSAISKYRATHSGAPNFAYELCTRKITQDEAARLDLTAWRVAYNGAEPVRVDTMKKFSSLFSKSGFKSDSFYPAYGLAEATLKVSGGFAGGAANILTVQAKALLQHRVQEAEDDEPNRQTFISCGKPSLCTEVRIICPETRQECEESEVGEIWVAGPGIAQGYWNKPDETESTFQAPWGCGDGRRYLRTGDLGFLKSRDLYVTGRLKDLIIVNGRNHYPHDIERTVEASSRAVRSGCTAAFSVDGSGEERVVVVAEIHRTHLGGWKDRGYDDSHFEQTFWTIQEAVTEQHDLRIFSFMFLRPGTLPKTSSGKIQRSLCRERFLSGTLTVVRQVGAAGSRPRMWLA
jgi:acyl-CoA synthetase (AMP-forming)/AMP-acid ligase II